MKLAYPLFEMPINFDGQIINQIVVENPTTLRNIIVELYNQLNGIDGDFILSSDKGDILSLNRFAEMYMDIFSLDFNNKKIINKIFNDLKEKTYNEDNYTKTIEVISLIQRYLESLIESIDCPLEISNDLDFNGIFKSAGLRIVANPDSHLERVIEYIALVNEVLRIELFIFINIKSYFSEVEVQEFYKFMQYKKLNVLVIESVEREENYCNEKTYTIDKDLCHIY